MYFRIEKKNLVQKNNNNEKINKLQNFRAEQQTKWKLNF